MRRSLLQRTRGKLGAGLGKTTGWIHRANLTKKGVTMSPVFVLVVKLANLGDIRCAR